MFKAASGYWRCISWTLGSWKVGKPSSLQGVLNYIIAFMNTGLIVWRKLCKVHTNHKHPALLVDPGISLKTSCVHLKEVLMVSYLACGTVKCLLLLKYVDSL